MQTSRLPSKFFQIVQHIQTHIKIIIVNIFGLSCNKYKIEMRFRRNPLPRRPMDILCFILMGIIFPLGFLLEIITVLPLIHEPGSFLYNFTILMAMFIFSNVMGNMIACMIIDTSVDPKRIPKPPDGAAEHIEWTHCTFCDKLSPPRSWHCNLCGVCILKRDHHCLFTGYCIGQLNHRYFMCFLFYLCIGSFYTMGYNILALWLNGVHFLNFSKFFPNLRTSFPTMMYQSLQDIVNFNCGNSLVILIQLNIVALFFSTAIFILNVPLVLRGQVTAESQKKSHKYCSNDVNINLRNVFGQRMYWAWLFPLFESQLPDDGYNWKANATVLKTK